MENLSTEATYALIVSIAGLIASIAGWIKVASNSKARESAIKARAEAVKIDFQQQILDNNKYFQKEIDKLTAENAATEAARIEAEANQFAEQRRWADANKKLSDELKEQLEAQASERAEMRTEIADYQKIVNKQGKQLEAQNLQIQELSTQVTGFKTLADAVVEDRNQIKAQLEKTQVDLAAALLTISEKDTTIHALKQEKDSIIQRLEARLKELEDGLTARDEQIKRLTEQVADLMIKKQLEDVPAGVDHLTPIEEGLKGQVAQLDYQLGEGGSTL